MAASQRTGEELRLFWWIVCAAISLACSRSGQDDGEKGPRPTPTPAASTSPEQLYLPPPKDSTIDLSAPGHEAKDVKFQSSSSALTEGMRGPCPVEMVAISGEFCIDRFEVSLVDAKTGRELSPHYPPRRRSAELVFLRWNDESQRAEAELGRLMPLPEPPDFQIRGEFNPRARSERGVLPAGYLSRHLAETACRNAGKRLCRRHEWVRACRGQEDQLFPYGEAYREGKCNVHRKHHPATLLHGDPSKNHSDPRLNLTRDDDGPLLRPTGTTPSCKSQWGDDAVYDMVGNVDEWIEDPEGAFLGGFYARATTSGCAASIDSHSPDYWDYSLGTRCCSEIDD